MKFLRSLSIHKVWVLALASFFCCIKPNFIQAQGHGQAQNVLADHAELNFRVRIKDSECKPLIAINETDSALTIEKISFEAGAEFFELSDIITLPKRLSPGESVSLGYACFKPKIPNKKSVGYIDVLFLPKQHLGAGEVLLQGVSYEDIPVNTVPPTSPAAIINFNPVSTTHGTLLSMVGKDGEFISTFNLKNTSPNTITINSVDFQKHDGRFDLSSVEPGHTLPMDIAPGELFSLRIAYHSFERLPSYNKILIFTDEVKDPFIYDIRGLQLPLSEMEWNKRAESEHTK